MTLVDSSHGLILKWKTRNPSLIKRGSCGLDPALPIPSSACICMSLVDTVGEAISPHPPHMGRSPSSSR